MPMITKANLEKAFDVYFKEIENCISSKCYWALLHMIINIPDICGALETNDGETDPVKYEDWCKRNLADSTISKKEWRNIRNSLLHQGKTLTKNGRYKGYKFTQPDPSGKTTHKITDSDKFLCIDVGEMAKEIRNALEKWFIELEKNQNSSETKNVKRNLQMLATILPMNKALGKGWVSNTMSASTGSASGSAGP